MRFTICVGTETRRAAAHIDVYDAPSADEAMQKALERVAREWGCDPNTLSIRAIAEGEWDWRLL
jgi:hypothetical protein